MRRLLGRALDHVTHRRHADEHGQNDHAEGDIELGIAVQVFADDAVHGRYLMALYRLE
ncbi:hypothetical protein D3C80_1754170 [compost metagenome]